MIKGIRNIKLSWHGCCMCCWMVQNRMTFHDKDGTNAQRWTISQLRSSWPETVLSTLQDLSGTRFTTSSRRIQDRSTYVDQLVVVSLFQVVQYRGVVQVGQVGHVLGLLILGRVHLAHLLLLKIFHLEFPQEGRDIELVRIERVVAFATGLT